MAGIGFSKEPKQLPKELTFDLGGVKLEMVFIPAGEFIMGSPDSDSAAFPWEKPQHRVRITKPFFMGKYLVTQEQWKSVMGNNPSQFKGLKNPVETVSWDDCQEFLVKLNGKFGTGREEFQLPTEAQWEYACRAGSTTRYYFGNETLGLSEYAWYRGNSGWKTQPVGENKPNAWGLYDTHGNVWEWCSDWYDDRYNAGSPTDDPPGPSRGSDRVSRGGGWSDAALDCRSAFRYGHQPDHRGGNLGFRVARVSVEQTSGRGNTHEEIASGDSGMLGRSGCWTLPSHCSQSGRDSLCCPQSCDNP
jgi:formylglycine-generating enzyme required for sulfatase activity